MDRLSDQQLLCDYSANRSEAAFAELVRRHVDLVYSAALRMVRDAHLAEDVTQGVFVALAQSARHLADRPALSGWLHRTAQNLAANAVRSDVRRHAREQEAAAMNELLVAEPDLSRRSGMEADAWEHIAPHLDAALGELNDADRDALLLRYFENKSLREVGQELGTSDDAAQKRVSRAVERLREFFVKRGISVGASGLVVVISANAVQAAPAGLAAMIAAAALTGTSIATTSTAIVATKAIAMTTLQKTLVTATVAVLAGAGIYEARQASLLRDQVQTIRQQQAPLAEKIEQLSREHEEADRQLAALRDDNERLNQNTAELLRLRGIAGVARRANVEAEQLRAQLARQTSESGTNPITGAMADAMQQATEQQAEGRLSRMTASLHLTTEQTQAAREILTRQAHVMSTSMQQGFSGKFDKEELMRLAREAGNPDAQIKALLTPDQQAAYPDYQQEEAAHNARMAANSELLQLQTLGLTPEQQDRAFAALYEVTLNQLTGSAKPPATATQAEAMQWTFDQKTRALESVLTPAQLKSYTQLQAIQAKLVKDILNKLDGAGGSNSAPISQRSAD